MSRYHAYVACVIQVQCQARARLARKRAKALLAEKAGFVLEEASEINANPKDTKDHPFGVWTLPPVRRTSPFGQPADATFDRAKYDAIGESDRMTLTFRKPE
jgi:predicted methyltransferase